MGTKDSEVVGVKIIEVSSIYVIQLIGTKGHGSSDKIRLLGKTEIEERSSLS